MTAQTKPATRHLTHEQLCDVLLALPSETESSAGDPALDASHNHLRDCLICSAELENLRESLALFRQAASSYAEQAYVRPFGPEASIAPSPRYRSQMLYWATAAALAIAVALPFGVHRQHTPLPQAAATTASAAAGQTAPSDEALLDGIAQDLSADVPAAMQPLADPTPDAAPAQSVSGLANQLNQRKN
jgi:hypothetical protein